MHRFCGPVGPDTFVRVGESEREKERGRERERKKERERRTFCELSHAGLSGERERERERGKETPRNHGMLMVWLNMTQCIAKQTAAAAFVKVCGKT